MTDYENVKAKAIQQLWPAVLKLVTALTELVQAALADIKGRQ